MHARLLCGVSAGGQPATAPQFNNYDVFPGQPRFWGATVRVKY